MNHTEIRPVLATLIIFASCVILGVAFSVTFEDWSMLASSLIFGSIFAVLVGTLLAVTRPMSILIRHCCSFLLKHWRMCALVSVGIALFRLLVPCPLQGNWSGGILEHLCNDHAFLRFEEGSAAHYHGEMDPQYWGMYRKIGWNTYSLRYSQADTEPDIIKVGWFFVRVTDGGSHFRLHRDFKFTEARRIVRRAQENARRVEERIHLVNPGMAAPEVWAALELSAYRTPEHYSWRTQEVHTADYMLYPGEILHCDWDMSSNPPILLEASFTGWSEGL